MSSNITEPDDLKEELTAYIAKLLYRITANLARVRILIEFPETLFPKDHFSPIKDDILRAAVVFLHATLEDFLRYIGSKYIPASGEDVLNRISLIGSSDILRPEKFFLGKLAPHREKKVDQLISESVSAYLDKVSFSNPTDISRFTECGVDVDAVREFYPALGELMARRHQIVHRADLLDSDNERCHRDAAPIEAKVTEWLKTVVDFTRAVANKFQAEFGDKMRKDALLPQNKGTHRVPLNPF